MRKCRLKERSAWSVLRDDVFVDLRNDGADDVLSCLVVIFHPRQHFEIADYQRFLYIVRLLTISQAFVRPDIYCPHFIRLRSDVTTAEDANEW